MPDGKSMYTLALPDASLTALALPPSEGGIDVFVVGENAVDPSNSPFMLLDLATSTVKADVDLSGAHFGQVVLCPQSKLVVTGSSDQTRVGFIRSYKMPLTGTRCYSSWVSVCVMSTAVVRVLSYPSLRRRDPSFLTMPVFAMHKCTCCTRWLCGLR